MTVYIVRVTRGSVFHIEATCQDDVAGQTAAKDKYRCNTGAHLTL